VELGINFFDTANVYSNGASEQLLGKALGAKRSSVVLATKVRGRMGPGVNELGLSRGHIMDSVHASLKRLGTDYIDLYQIHGYDAVTPLDETLRALDDLVRQGKVRYLGLSTNHYAGDALWEKRFAAWEIVETLWISERRGWERFVCLQPPYSILRRVMEAEHFPMTQRFGIANIVWSPLEGGWLTGKYRRETGNPKDSKRAEGWIGDIENPKFQRRLDVVEKLIPHAETKGVSLARFANAWALSNPAVTSVIIGPRTMEQLEDSLGVLDVEITQEDREVVDRLVPPGTSAL